LHPDSKGHTGYTIGFYNEGTFYNRSAKQSLVSTSSTHAEMRAIFTLVKDIIYVLSVCLELSINLVMPAIIMEDNSAVITATSDKSAYMKKCKHFLMLINYVREQVDLGIIKILKIPGTQNMTDVLTKPNFNEKDFETKTDSILGKRPRNDKSIWICKFLYLFCIYDISRGGYVKECFLREIFLSGHSIILPTVIFYI
jgi:hypothetical protein